MTRDPRLMGRRRRIEVVGATYHVTARGNERRTIFTDDRDYGWFVDRLGETVAKNRWRCLAYCLMPNHYHLVVELAECNLAPGMHVLNLGYVRRFNWRHQRVGRLLQGPYHAELIVRDEHYLESLRYVVLNPVRAALVAHPAEWRWSSYRASVGLTPAPDWLDVDGLRDLFDGAEGFRQFVEAA